MDFEMDSTAHELVWRAYIKLFGLLVYNMKLNLK